MKITISARSAPGSPRGRARGASLRRIPIYLPAHNPRKIPRDSWVYVRQYCAEIDEAARNRMELIVRSLAEQNGVTEKLKADTKWSGCGR